MKCHRDEHETIALGQTNTPIESNRKSQLEGHGIPVLQVPVSDKQGLAKAAAGCDVVYHLAGAQHEANVPDQYFRDINVEGTRNVLEASRQAGVSRFVLGSTIGVYGSALDGQIDDTTELRPNNIYEITKLESEQLVRRAGDDIEVSIIRISETYGPGDARLLKLFRAIKKGAFFVIGDGKNLHQLVYVDDLLRALLSAAERPQAVDQAIVVAGNEPLTTMGMCGYIADAVDVPMKRLRAPLWPFDVAASVLETVCRPLGVQPPLHKRRLDFFRKSFVFDTSRAADLLGFTPTTTFRDGARATAQWYVDNELL
jgi:nucleoside-diphosphate-sugar epimerase